MKKSNVRAAIEIVVEFGRVIKIATEESSLHGIPSGEFYARVMDKMSLEEYTRIIDLLKQAGVVKEENYLLVWIGPK